MEKLTTNTAVEMYTLDLAEVEKVLGGVTRPNLKRHLEEYRRNITLLIDEEKKKELLAEKNKSESSTSNTDSTISFVTVSKYALDNSEKFVK
jgi:hypothetical protein